VNGETEAAYAECRRVARESRSSFYTGMRLLAPARRDAIFAVYALARRIDDIADGTDAQPLKLEQLGTLRRELERIEESVDPVLVAVRDAAQGYPIPLSAFDDLLEGAERDVVGGRYETFPELVHYCRCVAGSIGRLCLGVFDASDRARAEPLADDLGVALQLVNILRDLSDDLQAKRVYLPQTDFARFGCHVNGDVIEGDAELLVAFAAERARGWLDHGLELVPLLDRRSAGCVVAMTAAYRRLADRIAENPAQTLRSRVSLTSWEKRRVLARSLAGALS
jgi:15-cis-phytoene synthase